MMRGTARRSTRRGSRDLGRGGGGAGLGAPFGRDSNSGLSSEVGMILGASVCFWVSEIRDVLPPLKSKKVAVFLLVFLSTSP